MNAIVWFQPYARRIVDSAKNAATHQVAMIPHPMSPQSWRLSGKEWRMKIVSIQHRFCGELVVNNPVDHRSDDASDNDLKDFHRVVGLDWIVTVATSRHHPLAKLQGAEKWGSAKG
jgi:hypothetical protein